MKVTGLYADEAIERFRPDQCVNIYDTLMRSFYCEATMNSLPEEVLDDPESFFLEPTDELSRPINVKEALLPPTSPQQ